MSASAIVVPMGFGEEVVPGRLLQWRKKPVAVVRQVMAMAVGDGLVRQFAEEAESEPVAAPWPELAFYRKYTEAMLRRYMRLAMETGRVPSLLGQEMFRGKVTSYRVHSFEDVVIFVYDVESCLKKLGLGSQMLIARIGLQEYTQAEVAEMLGTSLRSVVRRYADALDQLTAIFLRTKLMDPEAGGGKSCQAPKKPAASATG